MRRSLLSLVALLVASACEREPSVESITEENRPAIHAFIERVRAVRDHLGSAPTTHDGFDVPPGTVTTANTIVVAEMDFEELRTDPFANAVIDRYEWQPGTSVRPWSSFDLGTLVDAVRTPPRNPPETAPTAIGVIERAIALIGSTRFVAVARTDEATGSTVSGSTFTGASFRGHLALFDLEAGRWVGSVPVTVHDQRTETTIGFAVNSPSGQLNRRFNFEIEATMRRAIETGAAAEGAHGT